MNKQSTTQLPQICRLGRWVCPRSRFNATRPSIMLSGGKPTFPTCKFAELELSIRGGGFPRGCVLHVLIKPTNHFIKHVLDAFATSITVSLKREHHKSYR